MSTASVVPRSVKIIRWTARIWGVLVFVFTVMIIFGDPSTYPSLAVDWFLLGIWAAATAGLLIAWRWELAGGMFAIVMLFIREIAWVILKGDWVLGFLFIWGMILPPAILFLVAWNLERKSRSDSTMPGD